MSDDDQMWPSQTGDNADDNPRVIANHLKALRRDVNDKLDRIGMALEGLNRIEARLDVIIDWQRHQDRRIEAVEREQTSIVARLAIIESAQPLPRAVVAKKGRKPAGKK